MQAHFQQLVEQWIVYKIRLIEMVGLTKDAMHVHGSLLILFVAAVVLRRRPDSIWCWLIVFISELLNEYADLRGAAPAEATMDAALHDLYNTMFWPTIILLLGRLLFPRRIAEYVSPAIPSGNLAQQPFEQTASV